MLVVFTGLLIVPSGCVKEDFDTTPPYEDVATWTKTATIAQVKALYKTTAGVVSKLAAGSLGDSIVIEGVVISCDSASNFYETVTIMDSTGGIDLKINASELYLAYGLKPGKKVLVYANNMALDNYNGTYQLGLASTDAGSFDLTGFNAGDFNKFIQRSGKRQTVEPKTVKISDINTGKISMQTLVKLDSVQFWNSKATYCLSGVTTNRTIVDKAGNQLVLRTSGFAKFGTQAMPSGSGSITGVITVYGSTYQLYIRDLNDVDFEDDRFGTATPEPNKTIAELKALCTSSYNLITQDYVVDGVVNANDESGNIFKSIFIEDETGGIEFKVDTKDLYIDFPVGTKIVINCKGLYVGRYGGVVQLGGLYNSAIGRLSPSMFYSNVFIVDSGVEVVPIQTTIATLNDSYLGKIITLSDVQFADSEIGKTYAESSATTNRSLSDFNDNAVLVRTSNYANFAGIALPSKSGKLTAVLSKYNSDYQLYIRDLSDVRLLEPRKEKNFLLSQDFTQATVSSPITVAGWKTISEAGTRGWNAKQYSGDTYAEMNPYQSGEPSNIGWLVSPKVTLEAGLKTYLSFESQFAYWSGSTLQVYILTSYDGSSPWNATKTELTNAKVVAQSDGQNKWVKSGRVDLSAYSGDVYIAFKYSGGGSNTTAFRIDDVGVFTIN